MAFVVKARPGGLADSITGPIDDGSTLFPMLVVSGQHELWTPVIETTNASDGAPVFEHNELLYGRFNFTGYMEQGKLISLTKMVASPPDATGDANSNPPSTDMVFFFNDTSPKLTARIIVERIRISWNRTASVVGVSMAGRFTNDVPTMT